MMVHHLQLVIWKLRFNNKQKGYLYSISGRNYFTMHLRDIYISMLSFFRLETGVKLRATNQGAVGYNSNYSVFYCILHFYAYLGN